MNALAFQQRAQNTLLENGVERLHIGHGQGGVVKAHRFEQLVQSDGVTRPDTGPIQFFPVQIDNPSLYYFIPVNWCNSWLILSVLYHPHLTVPVPV